MRIGISAFAGDSGKSGISQYMKNIFKRLPHMSEDDEFVLFMTRSDREHFDFGHPRVTVVTSPEWVGQPLLNIVWHILWLPVVLAVHACDCVYLPAGNRRHGRRYLSRNQGTRGLIDRTGRRNHQHGIFSILCGIRVLRHRQPVDRARKRLHSRRPMGRMEQHREYGP